MSKPAPKQLEYSVGALIMVILADRSGTNGDVVLGRTMDIEYSSTYDADPLYVIHNGLTGETSYKQAHVVRGGMDSTGKKCPRRNRIVSEEEGKRVYKVWKDAIAAGSTPKQAKMAAREVAVRMYKQAKADG
jgi:hypothetical protein